MEPRLPPGKRVPADFYDATYYLAGTKSNYRPYGPGQWAKWLADMLVEYLMPLSVLDLGCATGVFVEELGRQGIPAYGFDLSEWAILHRVTARVWRGDVTDPASYRIPEIDLVLAMALVEHLTDEQNRALLANAAKVGKRLLILHGGEHGDPADHDSSHISYLNADWWISEAASIGWHHGDASKFNEDQRSKDMQWAPKFLLFDKLVGAADGAAPDGGPTLDTDEPAAGGHSDGRGQHS